MLLDPFLSDVDSVFDWMDRHDGSLSFFLTTALVVVTAFYVRFTYDLFKAQQAPLRREVVDEILPPVEKEIWSAIHNGYGPGHLFTSWRSLRHEKSALVYSKLFPRDARTTLNQLADGSHAWFDDYVGIRDAAMQLSLEFPPAGIARPNEKAFPGHPFFPIWNMVLRSLSPGVSVGDCLPLAVTYEYVWTNAGQRWPGHETIIREVLHERVSEIRKRLLQDAAMSAAIVRYIALLHRLSKLKASLDGYRRHVA